MDSNDATTAAAAFDGRYAELLASAHTLSSDELLDVIEVTQREIDAASARQAIALAHLSARDEHRQEDGTRVELHHGLGHQRLDAPELAASRMGVSTHVAENRLTDAIDQLTRTPAVVDAMASGDLDQRRAAIVTEQTEFLSSESAAAVVALVAPRWRGVTAGPLRRMVARAAAQVDPEAVAEQAAQARERRGLIRRVGVDGTDHWRGDFRVEQSRPAWAAVTERGRQLVREGQAASLAQGRSDAMMELILEHCEVTVVLHATHPAEPSTNAGPSTKAGPSTSADPPGDPAPPPSSDVPIDPRPTAAPANDSDVTVPNSKGLMPRSETSRPGTAGHTRARRRTAIEQDALIERGASADLVETVPAIKQARQMEQAESVGRGAASAGGSLVEVGGLGAPGTTFVPATWLRHQKRTSTSTKRRRPTVTTTTTGSETTVSDPARSETTVGDSTVSDPARRETTLGDSPSSDPIRREPNGDVDALLCHPVTGALVQGAVPASMVARGARFIQQARIAATNSADDLHDGYRIPAPLRRFVYLRDGGCRFPGCMVSARLCDVDHVAPWPTGPTASSNLIALCRRHHRIKQRDGWSVRLEPDGRVRWRDPSGHQRTTWPVDHLHLVSAASPSARAHQSTATQPSAKALPSIAVHPGAKAHPSATPASSDDRPAHRLQWLLDDPLPTTFEEELAELLDAEYRTPWGRRLQRERAAQLSMAHDLDGTPLTAPAVIDLLNPGAQGNQLILSMPPPPPEPIPF